MSTRSVLTTLFAVLLASVAPGHLPAQARLGIGGSPSESEIKTLDIAVGPHGEGLPPGKGSVQDGAKVYSTKCASCHGANGSEGPYDRLVGGEKPVKTIGSYWPYATTVFDYTRRAMPFNRPGTLSNDEVYAVTAWILWKNKIVDENAVMDAATLPKVQMPNRNGFVDDPRPDIKSESRPASRPPTKKP